MDTIASKYLKTVVKITDIAADASIEVCTNKLELNGGNALSVVECQASASGILYNTITGMEPRLMLNPEMKKLSEFDFFDALTNEKFYRIEITVADKNANGGAAFEPLKIVVPRAQMLSAPVTSDNGFLRNDITFRPLGNKESYVPTVTYRADADGEETEFDFTGSSLDGSENEATWYMIISEERVKDVA
jgi:hypothetical protein